MKTEQINLRIYPPLLRAARAEAKRAGYRNVQGFIEDAIRARVYDPELTPAEWRKVERWLEDIDHPERLVPESDLWKTLDRRISGDDRKVSGKRQATGKKRAAPVVRRVRVHPTAALHARS